MDIGKIPGQGLNRMTDYGIRVTVRRLRLSYLLMLPAFFSLFLFQAGAAPRPDTPPDISLPPPDHRGEVSLEEAIYTRRSIRSFADRPLSLKEVSQLLWAAGGKTIDGITGATRSYPSAGGIYPLAIYLIAGNVTGLPAGIYRYNWKRHSLALLKTGDLRIKLVRAALGQSFIDRAPASIVITADIKRTTSRYGTRGEIRYVPMDTGHAGQNVSLQAQALGLGSVIVGAFNDEAMEKILEKRGETTLYIIPVGREEK